MPAEYRKKLIEVALPLDAINAASIKEKTIRHGHPSTLHLWWARRPLAACRAVLFASLVDDPGNDLPPEEAKKEREHLFRMIERLVQWENSNNQAVLSDVRAKILENTGGNPPPVLDPFAGGGSIPLEAQRLGLEAHANDLNPVAVLINKALIELPAKFRNYRPVNPDAQKGMKAQAASKSALAEDVRWYGHWMRVEAKKRIGYLYPKGPKGETVIAWLWARTVKCPNPACATQMPLARSFWLSTKKGKEVWIEPVIDRAAKSVSFIVRHGMPAAKDVALVKNGTKMGRGASFSCLVCGTTPGDAYIKSEGMQKRLGAVPMAVVVEGAGGRTYLSPELVPAPVPKEYPDTTGLTAELPDDPRNVWCKQYGLITYADLFTIRQLTALTTFSDLVSEAYKQVQRDAVAAGLPNDGKGLVDGGTGARSYADAIAIYLAFALDKMTDTNTSICTWQIDPPRLRATFGRQALPMTWDSAEANVFGDAAGDYQRSYGSLCEVLDRLVPDVRGQAKQLDATVAFDGVTHPIISTDPPYYDNISYADLSDFFYIWLRRSIGKIYPDLFSTLLTPKKQELVAAPYRFQDGKQGAKRFFEEGLGEAFTRMRAVQHPQYPLTIYYAFKQSETEEDSSSGIASVASTGWETMLEGLLRADFAISGTWPIRSELTTRNIGRGTNALASAIVLVCRPRPQDAPIATRREFVQVLYRELPDALDLLIKGAAEVSPIAPVDLAQAAIGPGMAIFSRYSQVLEASGDPMRVRTALGLINGAIDAYFSHQEGGQDAPTRFCLAWYRTRGTGEGPYGEAETLSKATVVDIAALSRRGLLTAAAGKVRLRTATEYLEGAWNLTAVHPLITWEATHRLVAALARDGVQGAAPIARRLGGKAEDARALAYLLFTEATKHGWANEALGYNNLVVAWPDIQKAVAASQELQQGALM